MAIANLSELITTTLRYRAPKMADNLSQANLLYNRMNKSGTVKPVEGGRTIVQPLDYQENSTYKRYSGAEILDISAQELFSAAEFDWKQAAIAVTINGLEEVQNAGKAQLIDLMEARVKNAERTFINNLTEDMYSDGTATGGKQIGGLQLLVADDPTTGTVGGINRANYTFWRNYSYDATTDGGSAATSANIQKYMNTVFINTSRGMERPNLIVADNNYFNLYLQSLQSIQRVTKVTGDGSAGTGWTALDFMGVDVVLDGGVDTICPANHMYFLNTNYLHFRPAKSRNFVPIGGDRQSVNQDATVKLFAFAGNMTMSGAKFQGVLKD